jgi:F-type H+-transporting ATPase subunit alpha
LDARTRATLERGQRMTELLKQPQYAPVPLAHQVIAIWTATRGHMDDVEVSRVSDFERALIRFMDAEQKDLVAAIAEKKALDDDLEKKLGDAVAAFKKGYAG